MGDITVDIKGLVDELKNLERWLDILRFLHLMSVLYVQ
jgi:hypothetical protein